MGLRPAKLHEKAPFVRKASLRLSPAQSPSRPCTSMPGFRTAISILRYSGYSPDAHILGRLFADKLFAARPEPARAGAGLARQFRSRFSRPFQHRLVSSAKVRAQSSQDAACSRKTQSSLMAANLTTNSGGQGVTRGGSPLRIRISGWPIGLQPLSRIGKTSESDRRCLPASIYFVSFPGCLPVTAHRRHTFPPMMRLSQALAAN
jgi:hypothetical protein